MVGRPRHRTLRGFLAVVVMALAACGAAEPSDAGSGPAVPTLPADDVVAANIARSFGGEQDGALDTDEADCFGKALVTGFGVAGLHESGLVRASGKVDPSAAYFDETSAGRYADAFLGCVDYHARQALDVAAVDPDIDPDRFVACLRRQMPTRFLRRLIVAAQLRSDDAAALLEKSNRRVTGCKKDARS